MENVKRDRRIGVNTYENQGDPCDAAEHAPRGTGDVSSMTVLGADAEMANPMSRYPKYKRHRFSWRPKWESLWVKVTGEEGTSGWGR
jgi:hypothetical protein